MFSDETGGTVIGLRINDFAATTEGLKIGDPLAEITRLYPTSTGNDVSGYRSFGLTTSADPERLGVQGDCLRGGC